MILFRLLGHCRGSHAARPAIDSVVGCATPGVGKCPNDLIWVFRTAQFSGVGGRLVHLPTTRTREFLAYYQRTTFCVCAPQKHNFGVFFLCLDKCLSERAKRILLDIMKGLLLLNYASHLHVWNEKKRPEFRAHI